MIPPEMLLGLVLAFGLDITCGWPGWLYRQIGHPVGWLAAPVSACERLLNRPRSSDRARFIAGSAVTLVAIASAAVIWGGLAHLALLLPGSPVLLMLLFWPLIAARSMHDHVAAISKPLTRGDLEAARHAVAMIVGRDTRTLDQAGIARAALESLGENTSDGIVAPLFWGLLFGPGGMAAYKAINTLDSMIGHRNARYEWFGKLAARLDDAANLVPARLTGLLYVLASGRPARETLRVMLRDAGLHRSPNAGWPESALARAVGVRLSGPRSYGSHVADEPWLNGGAPDPDAASLARGLAIYRRLLALLTGILLALLVASA